MSASEVKDFKCKWRVPRLGDWFLSWEGVHNDANRIGIAFVYERVYYRDIPGEEFRSPDDEKKRFIECRVSGALSKHHIVISGEEML